MAGKILSESRYAKLVKDIRGLLIEGRASAERAAQVVIVETYWKIGKRINDESLTGSAHYGESILEDLAEELGTDVRTLQRAVNFFLSYNTAPRGRIGWAHYRELLGVKDEAARAFYEKRANREGWTRDQLVRAIRGGLYYEEKGKSLEGPNAAKRIKRPTEPTYIYAAKPERSVDGDTIILMIDLGFAVWKEQRLRLAEIDAPALDQPGGKEAFRFVRDRLAKAETVVVKTNKIDIYGRYIAHVFYTNDPRMKKAKVFGEGNYLNQELVNERLAKAL